jgi:predicted nucleotidyltransferase component of viral defense system
MNIGMNYGMQNIMLRDINSSFWDSTAFNGEKIREYSTIEAVNPLDFEKQIWVYDTLHIFKEYSDLDLILKGGTCIQSFIPLDYQRFSVDIDFNIDCADRTKDFILTEFYKLNSKLNGNGLLIPAHDTKHKGRSTANLVYGQLYPKGYDEYTGTITFFRPFLSVMERTSKTITYSDDLITKKSLSGVFNHLNVQVNIKHTLPALKAESRVVRLKISKYSEFRKDLYFRCSSIGDLFADKLLAFVDRKAFKDLYDLGMLVQIIKDNDIEICREKIKFLSKNGNLIRGSIRAINDSLDEKAYERHIHTLPREVRTILIDRVFYTRLILFLKSLSKS